MKILDRAKAAAEVAAAKAKEGVEDVQARKDLHVAYVELGKKTFELADAGTFEHAELAPLVAKVREAKAKLADEVPEPAAESEPSDNPS